MGIELIESIDNATLCRLAYSFVLSRDELQEENIRLYYLKTYNEQIIRTQKISSSAEPAAGIEHEVNNPLGIIKNYVTLLRIEARDPDGGACRPGRTGP
jgi:hypothetical protein